MGNTVVNNLSIDTALLAGRFKNAYDDRVENVDSELRQGRMEQRQLAKDDENIEKKVARNAMSVIQERTFLSAVKGGVATGISLRKEMDGYEIPMGVFISLLIGAILQDSLPALTSMLSSGVLSLGTAISAATFGLAAAVAMPVASGLSVSVDVAGRMLSIFVFIAMFIAMLGKRGLIKKFIMKRPLKALATFIGNIIIPAPFNIIPFATVGIIWFKIDFDHKHKKIKNKYEAKNREIKKAKNNFLRAQRVSG